MKAYKTVLIAAVVYSVVIGLIVIALATLAILARNCQLDMTGHPLIYLMFHLYFRHESCVPGITWQYLGVDSGPFVNLPDESAAMNRTFIFALIYAGLYAALICTALFSLIGINNSCLGRRSFPMFFLPWIIVCCAIVVMDVVATVYYVMDLVLTMSTAGLMTLLEVEASIQVEEAFGQVSMLWRLLPPIIMFMTTAKFFVFWVMDIVLITLITRAGWAASTYHRHVENTIRQYSSNMSRTNPAFEDTQNDLVGQKQHTQQREYMNDQSSIHEIQPRAATEPAAPPDSANRYNDTSIQPFVYPDRHYHNNGRHQEENQLSIPRPTSLALASKHSDRQTQQPLQAQHIGNGHQPTDREIEDRMSHFTTSDGSVVRSVEPLKDENISERQQQHQRIRVLPMVAEINRNSSEIKKERPPVPPKPYNPNRISMQPQPSYNEDRSVERTDSRNSAAKVDRTSSVNNELRSQLPWSYFKARDDIPKKSFKEHEDGDLPPVPIPDYTIHFPKAKRVNLSDSDDGSWSRYEQRY